MDGQITIFEWQQWVEDVRKRLQETAGNFVGIGYRLRQIRDSGILDNCADIFEFAQKEYGLGKSTVSRFIAINEKFSEGGNSLELRSEYRAIGSSKLSEMLTLPDAECEMITEHTTVKDIRELKNFMKEDVSAIEEEEKVSETAEIPNAELTAFQKCIKDYFDNPERRDMLNKALALGDDPDNLTAKNICEIINPSGNATHKKGIIFMFMYSDLLGVKYKDLTWPSPITLSWLRFWDELYNIFGASYVPGEDTWKKFFKEPEKVVPQKPHNVPQKCNNVPPKSENKPNNNKPAATDNKNTENITKPAAADNKNAENITKMAAVDNEIPENETRFEENETIPEENEPIPEEKTPEMPENPQCEEDSPVATSQQTRSEEEAIKRAEEARKDIVLYLEDALDTAKDLDINAEDALEEIKNIATEIAKIINIAETAIQIMKEV